MVSLIHVLEHVPDPADMLARCKELLRPDGLLFLAVPNDSPRGWYKRFWGTRRTLRRVLHRSSPGISYRETPPFDIVDVAIAPATAEIHLSHFSPECLRELLTRSGFDVVYVGFDTCYTTTGVRRLVDTADFLTWGVLYRVFGVFCYENMLMVARSRTHGS